MARTALPSATFTPPLKSPRGQQQRTMELEAEDGTTLPVETASTKVIGRGSGLPSSDRTVSRRHISFTLLAGPAGDGADPDGSPRLSFEVVGKNPILVAYGKDGARKVFRPLEKGELRAGDRLSVSLQNPSFFSVKEVGAVEKSVLDAVRRREERTLRRKREEEERALQRREEVETKVARDAVSDGRGEDEGSVDLGFGPMDFSQIDPVKEFGFLLRGHEFDQYPKQKVRAIKDWNWFLDEPGESSDNEDFDEELPKQKKGKRVKRRKDEENGDEDWTGESEDEKDLIGKVGSAKRPKYSTRSKDQKKPRKNAPSAGKLKQTRTVKSRKDEIDEEDEENEADDTLGGFIVHDEEGEEDDVDEEEEEEEEFSDEDDD